MRKTIKFFIFPALLLILAVLWMYIGQQAQVKKQIGELRKVLPDFRFYGLDSTVVGKDSLHQEQVTLLIYFNSECGYCQYEATELVKQADKLQAVNIMMVSSESISQIKTFYQKYNLSKIKHLQILKANQQDFYQYFGLTGVPNILIYNTQNQLIKHFQGETKMEAIISSLSLDGENK